MSSDREPFGTVDGQEVYLYHLSNKNGMKVDTTNYGGIVVRLIVPDKSGGDARASIAQWRLAG